MLGRLRTDFGWWVLLLAGCGGMLPPPPPPKMRTAPAATPAPAAPEITKPGGPQAPRGPNSAPDHFQVKFATTKGDFIVDVHRHWAPLGADRFYQLVKDGYYDGNKFFRVAQDPKIIQFGLNGNPEITKKWRSANIPDDQRTKSNTRGTVAFAAQQSPNTRTTQLFINTGDNSAGLDGQNFAPFGVVIEGLEEAVDAITDEYGQEPDQQYITQIGNTYLDERFPNLDYIITARVVDDTAAPAEGKKADDSETKQTKTEPTPDKPADPAPEEQKSPDGQ